MSKQLEITKIELLTTDGKPLTVPVIPYISAKKKAELNQIPIDFFTGKLNYFQELASKVNALAIRHSELVSASPDINEETLKQVQGDGAGVQGDRFKKGDGTILETINEITAKIKAFEAEHKDYYLYIHTFNERVDMNSKDVSAVAKTQRAVIDELFGDELNVNILRAIIKQDILSYEVKELINSDYSSDFWQNQDFTVIGETADYFRGFIRPRR